MKALDVMQESFEPVKYPLSDKDMIEDVIFNRATKRIYLGLKEIRGKVIPLKGNNLNWSLLKYDENDTDVYEFTKSYSKLMKALDVMQESFEPVKHPLSDKDMIEDVIFNKATKRSNFEGFYTAVKLVQDMDDCGIIIVNQLMILMRVRILFLHESGKNELIRNNFLDDVDLEDVENAIQMAGEISPGANALLQPLLIILKLPWDKIISLIKNMLGETPAALEIDIPSAFVLSRIGKIEFYMTPGGIKDVEFDDETHTFYLPILNLKSDSEDVRILHEKNIIEGDLDEDEIVKLFNGVTKSSSKTDEASGLQKTLARVNKYYGNVPRVKVYNFVKKHILAWWKVIAIVFTLLNLMLLVAQGMCQVYECNNGLGFSVVSFVFGFGTKNSRTCYVLPLHLLAPWTNDDQISKD
nr:putative UPF0481 protein At3g02645 [Tanacetum cinerariifolium]